MTFSNNTKLYEDFVTANTTNFDENAIKNAVRNILLTNKGSMLGRPDFGSRLLSVPFNMNDELTNIDQIFSNIDEEYSNTMLYNLQDEVATSSID